MKSYIHNLTEVEVTEDIRRIYESESWQPGTEEQKSYLKK